MAKRNIEELGKKICLFLLDQIASKKTRQRIIVSSGNLSYFVDYKDQKICQKLLNWYQKLNDKELEFCKKSNVLKLLLYIFYCSLFINSSQAQGLSLEEKQNWLKEIQFEVKENAEETIEKIKKEQREKAILEEKKRKEELENLKIQKELTYDNYITEYANYFHLDAKSVVELARKTTNNYESFENIIDDEKLDITNPEASSIVFIYLLSRDELSISLEDLGTSKKELVTSDVIETIYHDDLNEFYLSNGKKYSEFYGKVCDAFNIKDKALALSISLIEIGEHGSYSSNNRNNFGGMKKRGGELMVFFTPEQGIIYMCANLKKKYNDYSIDTIEILACHYVSGSKSMPKILETDDEETKASKQARIDEIMRWKNGVQCFYNKINENYEFYFPSDSQENEIVLARKNYLGGGSPN